MSGGSPRNLSTVAGVAWPPVQTGPAATLQALIHQLDATQWLDAATLAQYQREQLLPLARHCARHSRQFRARLAAAKLDAADLAQPGGLAALPPLSRRDLQAPAEEVACAEVPRDHLPLNQTSTSGATGEPVAVRRTAITRLVWMAMTMRDHVWHGRDFSGRLAVVRAQGDEGTQEDWGPPANLLYRTGPTLRLRNATDAAEQAARLVPFKPDALLIYPSSLAALVDHCRAKSLKLEGLRHIRTIGETLPDALRAAASEYFGAKVEDSYTSQEIGYMALECPESGRYHVMAENALIEVIDENGAACRPGETGRVVVTDLHNFATPMIRYAIGDFAEVAEPCPCGRGLPTLTRIKGRERNLVLMPDGTRRWPLTGYWRYRDIAPVRQYQFIQTGRETIEVRFVADRALTPDEEAGLRETIRTALGHPFALDFTYWPGRLPLSPSGKFEEFVCRVAA